jgi:hypothetical protein
MSDPVTYTAVLPVAEETVLFVSALLAAERCRRGTRSRRRALGCYRQAVLVLRWFVDGTRLAQLAADHRIGRSTAYRYLHEGIDALAAAAPGLRGALPASNVGGVGSQGNRRLDRDGLEVWLARQWTSVIRGTVGRLVRRWLSGNSPAYTAIVNVLAGGGHRRGRLRPDVPQQIPHQLTPPLIVDGATRRTPAAGARLIQVGGPGRGRPWSRVQPTRSPTR